MTVHIETEPGTADLLLFADPRNAAVELSRVLDARRTLERVEDGAQRAGSVFRDALNGRVAEAGGELLRGIDLGAVLLGGWQRYRELALAARRSVEQPGSTEMVRLAGHTITSKHAPYVDVYVEGQHVARVDFGIDLEFDVVLLQASIRNGRLMSLRAGDCTASITWSVEGFPVAQNTARLTMPLQLRLGEGIPLGGADASRS
ncbi:hypothetical protein [Sphaerisporangium perillae]|uniref:hypothetical protein n=1 Tax=Sphaerisporangium perillae TaxID=2935860 RepID=UPI00200EF9F3|nr:hypothetical protein [Sphaerisporangium perillae]